MWKLPWQRKKDEGSQLFKLDAKAKRIEGVEPLKASRLAALVLERTKTILEACPRRRAGSGEARQAAAMLAEAFSVHCDNVEVEELRASEKDSLLLFHILPVAAPIMLILCWTGLPFLALVIAAVLAFGICRTVLLCHSLLKGKGHHGEKMANVWASIEPEGEVERTIVFTAHHDSARMLNLERDDAGGLYLCLHAPLVHFIMLTVTSLSLFVTEIFTGGLLSFNAPPLSMLVLLVLLTLTCPLYWKLFHLQGGKASPGAGDNLVSCAMLTELAHYFSWLKGEGKGMDSTRLVFASFDGEECGLKGSEAWYAKHAEELVDACVVNIDCPIRISDLTILTRDVNGFQPLSKELAGELATIAQSMGWKARLGAMSFMMGASDAASAARHGFEATTLMGIASTGPMSDVIHSDEDDYEILDRKSLEAFLAICIKFAEEKGRTVRDQEKVKVPALEDSRRKFNLTR